ERRPVDFRYFVNSTVSQESDIFHFYAAGGRDVRQHSPPQFGDVRLAARRQRLGQPQRLVEGQSPPPLVGREIHVSRAEGQHVGVANNRPHADLYRQIEVGNHPPHHQRLLIILLPKVRPIGRHELK